MVGVDVGAGFRAVLSDGSCVSARGSPTIDLKQDIVAELFAPTPTAVIRAIDRLCIVSVDGAMEYCTTSLTWSVSFTHVNAIEIRVSGSVTPTASIIVGYFRAKAGDRVYFESAVSPPFDVQAGRSVSITMTVNASIRYRFNVGGGLPGDIYSFSVEFMDLLYTALSGRRPHDGYLTLERVDWADENINFLLSRELVRSYSPGATSGSASHDYANFMASGNLRYVFVQCTGSPECIAFIFPEVVSVTTADRARFSIVINVGYSIDLSDSLSLGLDDSWSWSVGFNFDLLGGVEVVRTDGEVVDVSLGVEVVRVDGQVVSDFRFGLEYIIS